MDRHISHLPLEMCWLEKCRSAHVQSAYVVGGPPVGSFPIGTSRWITWSCDSWWNPAILLNLSMLCWSIYNSCLKSLVSSKINFFVIVQRGISKTSLKALDVVLLSTSDSLKLYQFTTQVAPPFSEQYLQEGSWQLTEDLIEDQEIHRKKPTWCESLLLTNKKQE